MEEAWTSRLIPCENLEIPQLEQKFDFNFLCTC
jgi:hypothetical protein